MPLSPEAYDEKVLTIFLVEGKLRAIPAKQRKREVILRYLAEQFERERMYEEVEVNAILRVFHEDVAALRRYLVEAELLCRQIVRSVPAESLISGEQPSIQYSQMYWRP